MVSPIHKGLIINTTCDPGYAWVWIPTGKSVVPDGFSEYLYENTGGQLFGAGLSEARDSSYLCKVACPLTAGSWFRDSDMESASIFDDYGDTAYDYRIHTDYQTHGNNGIAGSYTFPTDTPRVTGAVAVSTLSVTGGNTTHQAGTLPKGQFPVVKTNQWVLVAFIDGNSNPIIFASLHSDEAWQVVQSQGGGGAAQNDSYSSSSDTLPQTKTASNDGSSTSSAASGTPLATGTIPDEGESLVKPTPIAGATSNESGWGERKIQKPMTCRGLWGCMDELYGD